MPVAPDDLPRSSSGRVPQWVVDEAAGLPPAPTTWRAAVPPPARRRTDRAARSESPASWVGRTPPDGWRTPAAPSWEERDRRVRPGRSSSAKRSVWLAAVLVLVLAGGRWAAVHPDRVSAAWTGLTAGAGPFAASPGTPPAVGVGQPGTVDPAFLSPDGTHAFMSVQTLADGSVVPVTWSTCGQVRYTVATDGAPPTFRDDVARVAQELSDATGLAFLDVDTSTLITRLTPAVRVERTAAGRDEPVLIAFTDETSDPVLEGDVAGVASASAWTDLSGRAYFTSGVVHLDVDLLSYDDNGGEPAYVGTLRHEMGHIMGLDHVDDQSQLMTPVEVGVHTYQAGDLAGLAVLGAGGCASGL